MGQETTTFRPADDKRKPPLIIRTSDYTTSMTIKHDRCGGSVMQIEHIRRSDNNKTLFRLRCANCQRVNIMRVIVEQIG